MVLIIQQGVLFPDLLGNNLESNTAYGQSRATDVALLLRKHRNPGILKYGITTIYGQGLGVNWLADAYFEHKSLSQISTSTWVTPP